MNQEMADILNKLYETGSRTERFAMSKLRVLQIRRELKITKFLDNINDKSNRMLVALVSVILLGVLPANYADKTEASTISWQSEMLNRVNEIRIANQQKDLKYCKSLQIAAQRYADYMSRESFLSHRGKDGSTVGDRLIKAGYLWKNSKSGSYIGENIAAGQRTVREVVAGWKSSPSHLENMISMNFTHVGFGRSKSANSKFGIFWVQNFGSGVNC